MKTYDTVTEAINDLTLNGYTEDFRAYSSGIKATQSKKEYSPEDLLIVHNYHFEGDTSPDNSVEIYTIEAHDGTKGTMVVSYAAEMDQDPEMIRKIKFKS